MTRIVTGDATLKNDAVAYASYQKEKDAFSEKMDAAKENYVNYLRENFAERDIFKKADLDFLLQFDERVTYKKPIHAMILMLARSLRARNGNIIAAAAGYNAGLSRTKAHGPYRPFGRIPNFDETATYISRVLINHYEISRRLI